MHVEKKVILLLKEIVKKKCLPGNNDTFVHPLFRMYPALYKSPIISGIHKCFEDIYYKMADMELNNYCPIDYENVSFSFLFSLPE